MLYSIRNIIKLLQNGFGNLLGIILKLKLLQEKYLNKYFDNKDFNFNMSKLSYLDILLIEKIIII